MSGSRLALTLLLVLLGMGWGATVPLTKVAVSTGHGPLGLIFWSLTISVLMLGAIQLARRRPLRPERAGLAMAVLIALTGTLIPNTTSYLAARHLPGGVMALVIAMVPLFAFPVALALGMDRFSARRLAGLMFGLSGVALIALPEGGLPDPALAAWVPLALIAPFMYGIEGNAVARWGTGGMGPIQTLFVASLIGLILVTPLVLLTGQFIVPAWPLAAPERALAAQAMIHAVTYAAYVWLVGQAGSVFAGQVGYLVTGFGLVWSMIFLGERYSGWLWAAAVLLMAGLALVKPRDNRALAEAAATGETA